MKIVVEVAYPEVYSTKDYDSWKRRYMQEGVLQELNRLFIDKGLVRPESQRSRGLTLVRAELVILTEAELDMLREHLPEHIYRDINRRST